MSQEKSEKAGFVPPPHANAETHRRLMAKWKKMSDEEFFLTLVSAGIYDKKGNLRPPYADEGETKEPKAQKTATRRTTATRKATSSSRRSSASKKK